MLRNGFVAVTAVAALAVAGCGGSSNKSSSYSAFVAKANAVCKAANKSIKPLSSKLTGDPQHDASLIEQLIPKQKAATASFKALNPPSELKSDFDKFNTLTEAQVTATIAAQKAAKTGDKAAYVASLKAIPPIGKKTDLEASKLGAAACTH